MPNLKTGLWVILFLILIPTSVHAAGNVVDVELQQQEGMPAAEARQARRAEDRRHIKSLAASPLRLNVPIQAPTGAGGGASGNQSERNRVTTTH